MALKLLLSFFLMIGGSLGNKFKLYNNCPFTIWPGIQGNPGNVHLERGGFKLELYQARTIETPENWAGRIWARTQCDNLGNCVTGDCGGTIQCNGSGSMMPGTFAGVKLKVKSGLDFYGISVAEGFNLPIKIKPTSRYTKSSVDSNCTAVGCYADINAQCPSELSVRHSGTTVICKSACKHFNTDQYCCRAPYGTPWTCRTQDWPVDYAATFKNACPHAFSQAYDVADSIFTCRGAPHANYEITFCPFIFKINQPIDYNYVKQIKERKNQ